MAELQTRLTVAERLEWELEQFQVLPKTARRLSWSKVAVALRFHGVKMVPVGEFSKGFDYTRFVNPVRLNDETETGGLFGLRI